jgi:hypothetical protein
MKSRLVAACAKSDAWQDIDYSITVYQCLNIAGLAATFREHHVTGFS